MGSKSAEGILNTIDQLGSDKLSVQEKIMFKAILEDSKSMDARMTKLENNVTQIAGDVIRLNDKLNNLDDKINLQTESINRLMTMFSTIHEERVESAKKKQELTLTVLKSPYFWIILILMLIIISGTPISELKGIFSFTGN